ncbi:hypothetical protein BDV96DRAFT_323726 [Lophiotrema nucula]|uniref:Uncharacterized protein n=1 Tax=Lophiotrema nucula TaxID=690887 RepID=A0A6A5ZMX3_9PLEO|nr:hypothetical protein BDV96DRAFT_323726 [Lophiotrema nucula]
MPFPFLRLPRELRDLVYEHYVAEKGGYLYDFATYKLTTVDSQPIDLSLSRSCTLIATEMRGVALGTNAFRFKTGYTDDARLRAGRFDRLLAKLNNTKCSILSFGQACITAQDAADLASAYPQLVPLLTELQRHHGYDCDAIYSVHSWGEAPSVLRQFIEDTLSAISTHPNFVANLSHAPIWDWHNGPGSNPHEILSLPYKPWSIPTDGENEDFDRAVAGALPPWRRERYRFSAAAVAVQYLASLPHATRAQLRKIILEEDRVSVANPECHAQGLIQYCQENPQLRVERRVSLWRNVFRSGSAELNVIANNVENGTTNSAPLVAICATLELGRWIVEAQALPFFGMPSGAFSLVLDSDGIPRKTSQVFELLIQRDVAWQVALEECYARSILPMPSWFDRRRHGCYKYEGLPAAMRDIVDCTSNIRCDFDPGEMWDVEELILKHRLCSSDEWSMLYTQDSHKQIIEPSSPLPTMLDICLEDVLLDEPD